MNIKTEEDLLAQMDSKQSQYGDKFLKEIHPLIKKYYNTTGNDFEFEIDKEISIKYNGYHYWVLEGDIFGFDKNCQTGLWFDEKGVDIHGRKYGGERNSNFNFIARLCCKYQKEIKSKIIHDLQGLVR